MFLAALQTMNFYFYRLHINEYLCIFNQEVSKMLKYTWSTMFLPLHKTKEIQKGGYYLTAF